ncbi:hypothetical protein ADUPG1_012514 [Aduncisulcus paluster]|uniref:RRM domain-containing protein n=1 Tax=Aduncisulcus paluster TaxID=2918883 RepID=A0ABQ5K0H1_9EUKA|nr:hypothetical protein ADUPG1_012514 [Aduncisulcus paluster]|eukprot:gnl/Carplike_NY0171/560_a766_2239.p1 GENE.gnl/Carplike_NY0171/560_a766_2239~~gnl/Carplike_NY0171/560_a766_2239.p1  ORF type:complete len:516 (-),score=150.52 gnl/Carplike_NY0171/560_a766_2239:179-1726(-)
MYPIPKIYVGNIPELVTEEALQDICLKFGSVEKVKFITYSSGKPKGYGFVTFTDMDAAQNAVKELKANGYTTGFAKKVDINEELKRLSDPESKNLYFCHIPKQWNEDDLKAHVVKATTRVPEDIYILRHQETHESKGVGFATMKSHSEAQDVISALSEEDGVIRVRFAFNEQQRSARRKYNQIYEKGGMSSVPSRSMERSGSSRGIGQRSGGRDGFIGSRQSGHMHPTQQHHPPMGAHHQQPPPPTHSGAPSMPPHHGHGQRPASAIGMSHPTMPPHSTPPPQFPMFDIVPPRSIPPRSEGETDEQYFSRIDSFLKVLHSYLGHLGRYVTVVNQVLPSLPPLPHPTQMTLFTASQNAASIIHNFKNPNPSAAPYPMQGMPPPGHPGQADARAHHPMPGMPTLPGQGPQRGPMPGQGQPGQGQVEQGPQSSGQSSRVPPHMMHPPMAHPHGVPPHPHPAHQRGPADHQGQGMPHGAMDRQRMHPSVMRDMEQRRAPPQMDEGSSEEFDNGRYKGEE